MGIIHKTGYGYAAGSLAVNVHAQFALVVVVNTDNVIETIPFGFNACICRCVLAGEHTPHLNIIRRFYTEAAGLLRTYHTRLVASGVVDYGKHLEREAAAHCVVYGSAGTVRNGIVFLVVGCAELSHPALVRIVEIRLRHRVACAHLCCNGRNILDCAVLAEHDVHKVGYGCHLGRRVVLAGHVLGYILVCAVHEVHLVARYRAGVHARCNNLSVERTVACQVAAFACVTAYCYPCRAFGR